MNIPIKKVNTMYFRVLSVTGIFIGLWMSGCSNTLLDSPIARMGSASNIEDKLAATQALHGTDIEVNTHNGKNILSGVVHTKKQKFLASSVARSVEGSGTVVNQLVVR